MTENISFSSSCIIMFIHYIWLSMLTVNIDRACGTENRQSKIMLLSNRCGKSTVLFIRIILQEKIKLGPGTSSQVNAINITKNQTYKSLGIQKDKK